MDVRYTPVPIPTQATRAASHPSLIPRQPSKMNSIKNGTTLRRIGVIRPIVAPTKAASSPPSLATVVTGIAMAPKPTLRALPTITAIAARMGCSPSAHIIVHAIATGAPNPASPSSRPQKAYPISKPWMRMSPLPTAEKTACTSFARPERSVRLYSHTAITTM
ncbi:Uncharacterised protein [Chlamydia trachomatis]|nr:Uncharacterised protein [Chlamydia trachomatis]